MVGGGSSRSAGGQGLRCRRHRRRQGLQREGGKRRAEHSARLFGRSGTTADNASHTYSRRKVTVASVKRRPHVIDGGLRSRLKPRLGSASLKRRDSLSCPALRCPPAERWAAVEGISAADSPAVTALTPTVASRDSQPSRGFSRDSSSSIPSPSSPCASSYSTSGSRSAPLGHTIVPASRSGPTN